MAGGFREICELAGLWMSALPSVGEPDGGYGDILELQGVFLPATGTAPDPTDMKLFGGFRHNVGKLMR